VTSDAPAPPESGTVDAPADAGALDEYGWDANACSPGAVQTFHPTAYIPALRKSSCVGVDPAVNLIDQFYTLCLGTGRDAAKCALFQSANSECYDCLLTPSGSASYGPVIRYSGFVEANIAGCIELASRGALGCAESVQALEQCDLAACEANCPVTDPPSLAAFEGCATDSEMTVCKPYAGPASCLMSDSGPLSVCDSADFAVFYKMAAPLFCAASADGGGAPAVVDAGSD
jgi:hypothetical protein